MPPQSFTGPSILETSMALLDEATAAVMEGDSSDKAKGRVIGMSQIIAVFLDPYNPRPKAVREAAKAHWRAKQ